jgi:hypothetical protein
MLISFVHFTDPFFFIHTRSPWAIDFVLPILDNFFVPLVGLVKLLNPLNQILLLWAVFLGESLLFLKILIKVRGWNLELSQKSMFIISKLLRSSLTRTFCPLIHTFFITYPLFLIVQVPLHLSGFSPAYRPKFLFYSILWSCLHLPHLSFSPNLSPFRLLHT